MINIQKKIYDFESTRNHFQLLFHMNIKGQPFKLSTCLYLPYCPTHTLNLVILKACLRQSHAYIFPTIHSLKKSSFSPTFMRLPSKLCSQVDYCTQPTNIMVLAIGMPLKSRVCPYFAYCIQNFPIKLSYPWAYLCNQGRTPALPFACSIVV